jgi:hypothetical protein
MASMGILMTIMSSVMLTLTLLTFCCAPVGGPSGVIIGGVVGATTGVGVCLCAVSVCVRRYVFVCV